MKLDEMKLDEMKLDEMKLDEMIFLCSMKEHLVRLGGECGHFPKNDAVAPNVAL